jgi:hypothetical protein
MYDKSRIFKSALEKKMDGIRSRRRGVDPRTGRPYATEIDTEKERLAQHAKLNVCHQNEDGPCKWPVTIPPGDTRCSMSRRMKVSCPYLGKVEPLKKEIEEQQEEERLDELIQEAPPDLPI